MDLPDNLEPISNKNIVFNLEEFDLLDRWLKAVLSDVFLHLKKDFENQDAGKFQIAWQLNKIKDIDNGREMDSESNKE